MSTSVAIKILTSAILSLVHGDYYNYEEFHMQLELDLEYLRINKKIHVYLIEYHSALVLARVH